MTSPALCLALVLQGGCVSGPKPGSVYRDWAARMSEMGIFPVFPPREDVYPGDVYLLPTHPYDAPVIGTVGGAGNAGFHKQNLLVDDVIYPPGQGSQHPDLYHNLTNYYLHRPVLPSTAAGAASSTGDGGMVFTPLAGPAPTLSHRKSVFEPVALNRLKQVAFPDFAVTTVAETGISAMVPIEAIRASFGFSSADVSQISFKIPQAESYGLPSDYLLPSFFVDYVRTDDAGSAYILLEGNLLTDFMHESAPRLARVMFNDSARFLAGGLKQADRKRFLESLARSRNHIYLSVISEVYYARSMDIQVEFTKSRGTSVSARPFGFDELNSLKQFLGGPSAVPTNSPASSAGGQGAAAGGVAAPTASLPTLTTNLNVFDLVAQLRTNNIEPSGNIPGGQVKVVSVSQNSVGMRRTFEQPIAVGVRGTLLKVELDATTFTKGSNTMRGFKIVTKE